jgi:transcriptional regulator with XRE-family HTH domain
MGASKVPVRTFLEELMYHRKRLPSQLAVDLGISHATVGRWLSGEDVPSTKSCRKLAEYSGVPLERVLSIAGHLPREKDEKPIEWSENSESSTLGTESK